MKVLFLTSWFPSRLDPTLGNFVERHLQAVRSVGCEVMVVHEVRSKKILRSILETENNEGTDIHHLFLPGLYKNLNGFAYKKIKRIIAEFNPDLIHGHVFYPVGEFAQKLSGQFNLPMIFTEHSSVFKEVNQHLFNRDVERVVKKAASKCRYILPVSKDLGKSISKKGIDTPQQVVYNCVDTSLFRYAESQLQPDTFTFLHISNFDKRSKNTEGIVEAFSKLDRKAKLIIAGDGDLERVKDFANDINSDTTRLEFYGTLDYPEVAELMKKSNCHVLFSNFENLPCVIAESLCCGLPNIATAVGGVPEMIDGTNGLMIEPGDVSSLKSAMQEIIDKYSFFHRPEISAKAQEKYSYKSIGRELIRIYERLLE